jgi:hypothetical protein
VTCDMEIKVWDKIPEAHFKEEDSVDVKYWTVGVHKAVKLSSEILCRWYLQCRLNRFILSHHARLFSKLRICSCIWFEESNGFHNCVVLFKHVRNW